MCSYQLRLYPVREVVMHIYHRESHDFMQQPDDPFEPSFQPIGHELDEWEGDLEQVRL